MSQGTICTCGLIKQSKAGTAVDEAGITRCNNCGKPTTFAGLAKAETMPGGAGGAAPAYRRPPVRKQIPSLEASGQIAGLMIGGLLATVVGVVGSLLFWPRPAGLAIFGLVAGLGEVLVLVAVIAYGVRLGIRASGVRDDVASDG